MIDHPSYKNTRSTEQEAHAAIDRSKSHTEIVHLPWSDGAARILEQECEGSADANNAHEYWGVDCDGTEWRVHLDKADDS